MPIYEFRCLKCNDSFELLVMKNDKMVETKCPSCDSAEFERIMSTTNHSMGPGSDSPAASSQTRTCSSGNCTTYEIPGPS